MVDTATIQSPNPGPSLEEEAAALEAANATPETPALAGEEAENTEERPEWLPEKFKSVEDMAKAYAELEKRQGSGEEASPDGEAQEAAEGAVESAGLDMAALETEFADSGELSEASLAALEKAGIPKATVDAYIAGQVAQAEAATTALLADVGGQEAYAEMTEWASENMSDAEIDAFNGILEAGNPAATKLALGDLKAKFVAANGSEPQVRLQGNASSASGSTYDSVDALMKDMQNPEYHTNESFRAKVAAKLDRSSIM